MIANANLQLDGVPLDRGDRAEREIVAICSKHGIAHGEPENLVGFMRALDENKHLAMNFWSLVARLTRDPDRSAQPDWLLTAIVEGVAGRSTADVAAAGPGYEMLLSRLRRILAGEDVTTPAIELPFSPARELNGAEPRGRRTQLADTAEVTPTAPRTLAGSTKSQRCLIAPITNPAWLRDEKLHLVLDPESASDSEVPVTTNSNSPKVDDDSRALPITGVIPLAGYLDSSSREFVSPRILGAGLSLALLAVCGFWVMHTRNEWPRAGSSMQAGYASAIASWMGQQTPAHAANVQPAKNAGAINPARPSAIPPAPVRTQADILKTQPPTAPLASAQKITAAPVIRQQNILLAATIKPQRDVPPATAAPVERKFSQPQPSNTSSSGIPGSNAPVILSEGEMQQNLASSRVPIYPEAARANRIGGRVELQAIVSRDGSVGHLHVVSGDPQLRRAAMDAVATWRYRPYLQNGRPVDVSTTITVDFSNTN